MEDEVGGIVQIRFTSFYWYSAKSICDITNGWNGVFGRRFSILYSHSFRPEDIPSDISLLWTSDIDGELSSSLVIRLEMFHLTNQLALNAGLHSLSVLAATDSTGLTVSDSRSFRVNTPPNTPVIHAATNLPETGFGCSSYSNR